MRHVIDFHQFSMNEMAKSFDDFGDFDEEMGKAEADVSKYIELTNLADNNKYEQFYTELLSTLKSDIEADGIEDEAIEKNNISAEDVADKLQSIWEEVKDKNAKKHLTEFTSVLTTWIEDHKYTSIDELEKDLSDSINNVLNKFVLNLAKVTPDKPESIKLKAYTIFLNVLGQEKSDNLLLTPELITSKVSSAGLLKSYADFANWSRKDGINTIIEDSWTKDKVSYFLKPIGKRSSSFDSDSSTPKPKIVQNSEITNNFKEYSKDKKFNELIIKDKVVGIYLKDEYRKIKFDTNGWYSFKKGLKGTKYTTFKGFDLKVGDATKRKNWISEEAANILASSRNTTVEKLKSDFIAWRDSNSKTVNTFITNKELETIYFTLYPQLIVKFNGVDKGYCPTCGRVFTDETKYDKLPYNMGLHLLASADNSTGKGNCNANCQRIAGNVKSIRESIIIDLFEHYFMSDL